jgi:type IV pilus assembly protein PilA
MKSEFKAKYLQHLVRKNKGNEGFTLIELLVVIIIVGVLAAIALPSFLNQIGKARGSEAKSSLGTMNRSQQAYRLENNTFATASSLLDAKITSKFYSYSIAGVNSNYALHGTTPQQTDLKDYASGVVQGTGDTFSQVICESNDVSGNTTASENTATATNSATAASCSVGKEVK